MDYVAELRNCSDEQGRFPGKVSWSRNIGGLAFDPEHHLMTKSVMQSNKHMHKNRR